MNGAYLHLALNHVSLFALIFGIVALIIAMRRKSTDMRVLAVVLFVVVGVFAYITIETGEQAADVLKTLGGDNESFIKQHAEAAVWALRSGILIATLAIVMEWAARKKTKWLRPLQWILLIFALHGSTVFGFVASLGGQIRHTEIRSGEAK